MGKKVINSDEMQDVKKKGKLPDGTQVEETEASPVKKAAPAKKKSRWLPITLTAVISAIVAIVGTVMMLALYIPSVDNWVKTITMSPLDYYLMTETRHFQTVTPYVTEFFYDNASDVDIKGTYSGSVVSGNKTLDFMAVVTENEAKLSFCKPQNKNAEDVNLWFRNDSMYLQIPDVSPAILKNSSSSEGTEILKQITSTENNCVTSSEMQNMIYKYSPMLYMAADDVTIARNIKGNIGTIDYKCNVLTVTYRNGKAATVFEEMLTEMKSDTAAVKLLCNVMCCDRETALEELDNAIAYVKSDSSMKGDFSTNVYVDNVGNVIGRKLGNAFYMLVRDNEGNFDLAVSMTGENSASVSLSGYVDTLGKINATGKVSVTLYNEDFSFPVDISDFSITDKKKLLINGTICSDNENKMTFTAAESGQEIFVESLLLGESFKVTISKEADTPRIKIPYDNKIYDYDTEYETYLENADFEELQRRYNGTGGLIIFTYFF